MIFTLICALLISMLIQAALAQRVRAMLGGRALHAAAYGIGSLTLAILSGYSAVQAGWPNLILGLGVLTVVRALHCGFTVLRETQNG